MDAVEALDAAFDASFDAVLFYFLLDDVDGLFEKFSARLAPYLDRFLDGLVSFGVEIHEGEVFKLAAHLAHAQTMRDGRVNLQRLLRDHLLTVRRQMFQGA